MTTKPPSLGSRHSCLICDVPPDGTVPEAMCMGLLLGAGIGTDRVFETTCPEHQPLLQEMALLVLRAVSQ